MRHIAFVLGLRLFSLMGGAPGEGPRFEAIRYPSTVTALMKGGEARARLAMARELIVDERLRQHAAHAGSVVSQAGRQNSAPVWPFA